MSSLNTLIKSFLVESVTLTKGSQSVMNDKNLVSKLASRVRRDAEFNPSMFPPKSAETFEYAPDEEVVEWFLSELDKIEKAGYEGTIYSRNGLYSDWIVRNYIAGKHTWEDLTGVMAMNLRDWTLLKALSKGSIETPGELGQPDILRTKDVLDPQHNQISKFKGVRELGYYLAHHYGGSLEALRDKSKYAARDKLAKNIKLIDNTDYKVYITLNRASNCKMGLGTQWCTANSDEENTHFNRYANDAMLYQVYPKEPEKVDKISGFNGKRVVGNERYQFGPDSTHSFKDIADDQVPSKDIKKKFPYLYTDLVKALTDNKARIEEAFAKLNSDVELQSTTFGKTKTYDIDNEIDKLKRFVDLGMMDEKVRPPEKVKKDETQPAAEQPATEQPEPPVEPTTENIKIDLTNKGITMENIDKDVEAMLNNLKKYDKLVESCAPVLGMKTLSMQKPEIDEHFFYSDNSRKTKSSVGNKSKDSLGRRPAGGVAKYPDEYKDMKNDRNSFKSDHYPISGPKGKLPEEENLEETSWDNLGAEYIDKRSSTGGTIKTTDHGVVHKAKPLTGKAPKDKEPSKKVEVGAGGGNMHVSNDDDRNMSSDGPELEEATNKPVYPSKEQAPIKKKPLTPFKGPDEKETDKVEESADQDILDWMNRFSKLGNMKGYGR